MRDAGDAAAGDDGLRLPRPPGVVRRFLAAHPATTDAIVVAVVLLAGWVEVDRVGLEGSPWEVLGGPWLVANACTAAALLLRRTRPVVPLAVVALSELLVLVDDRGPLTAPWAVLVYTAAVERSALRGALVALTTVVLTAGALLVANGATGSALVVRTAVILIALLLGTNVGNRRRYLAAVLERAAQLAVERDQRAALAAAAERSRIARELHDVVAHGLSVMVRLSDGALAVAETEPERARDAVARIGRIGRESMRDMRLLLGVLGEEDAPPQLGPQPGLADLDGLVETYRSAGLPVVVERTGAAELDPAAQLVVFRTVQEALTNSLRYAVEPRRVVVRLRLGSTVEVDVQDDGRAGPARSIGAERGLIGVRERAQLYGGTMEAGPLPTGGWLVRVRLPLGTATEGGDR